MNNFELLKEKFNNIEFLDGKIIANDSVYDVLSYLKMKHEFNFDMLTSIVATDFIDYIQLTYKLYSTSRNEFLDISTNIQKFIQSVVKLYKSAHFDECEIYDLFGVEFLGNDCLKRLYLPETWIGNPLLKNYKQSDQRLAWNE